MTRVLVAGVVSVRVAQRVPAFPVPFVSNKVVDGGLTVQLAGGGWTAATTARALGADVRLATYVGADPLGLVVEHELRARGWYDRGIQVCESQPRALVLYDETGTRCGTSDLGGAWELRYPAGLLGSLLDEQGTDIVLMASVGFTRSLIDATLERRIPIATDLQCVKGASYPRKQDWMRAATIVSCSHESLRDGPLGWIEALWHRFATPVVLVGCGADGALVATHEDRRIWHVGASAPRGVRFVDGAGDAMLAAFTHHYFDHGEHVTALRYASLAAGWLVGGGPDDEFDLTTDQLIELGTRQGLPDVLRVR
jgi:sugar/nucleoside kinase (ribokinase family)